MPAQIPVMNQHTPPPSLEQVCKLQLIRTTLVKFIDWKDFDDVVRGCYVRVLLEMRAEDRARDASDSYYVAVVKGAKKGPSYSGFSWDGISTEWHIIIELPPCFKSSPTGNLVQLSSISNTPFKPNEYQQWVEMTRELGTGFMTEGQITLRMEMLREHFNKASNMKGKKSKRHNNAASDVDPALQAQRDSQLATMKQKVEADIRKNHLLLPLAEKLNTHTVQELHEIERQCLDVLQELRASLNERTKCQVCHAHVCTVVCYPCKHLVLCPQCSVSATVCPVAKCGAPIQDKFEAYT